MKRVYQCALHSMMVILAMLPVLSGCGSGSGGPVVGTLAPVTGKVMLKGAPLLGGSVMFTPITGTPGTGAFGTTDDKGEYKLVHRNQKVGIEPGNYRVVITRMAMKDGSPIPAGKSAADVEAVQIIPPPFSDPNSSYPGTAVTVPATGAKFDFDIPVQ